ncbi:aminopeptidase, partial [Dimargaris xerosporica]
MGQPTSETHPHLIQAGHITPGITSEEYAQRRARLADALPADSVAIIFGHPLSFKATHVFYPFHQQSDFLYLTGFNEPDAVLLIEKGAHSSTAVTSILFVPPQDDASERWEGPRAGIDGVRNHFGDYEAYGVKELEDILKRVLASRSGSAQSASSRADGSTTVSLSSLVSDPQSQSEPSTTNSLQVYADIPLNYTLRSSQHVVHSVLKQQGLVPITISPLIQNLRVCKSDAEVVVMQRCSDLTAEAFRSTIQRTKECKMEHEVYALFEYECRRRGAEELAYVPVVAAGENALSMHYVLNNQVLRQGDMLLLDGGASWGYYASDVTRTWPLFGQPFSTPQAELYQAVLNTQKACI